MPQYKKPGTGRDFQPGHAGGPGRPPLPAELKEIKRLTKGELELLITKVIRAGPGDLKQFTGTALEMFVASCVSKSIKTGNWSMLDPMLSRVIGPLTSKIDLNVKPPEQWTREEKLRLLTESEENIKKLRAELEDEPIEVINHE